MSIETIKEAAQRQIWVTLQKEGIHCYPAAATHRHIFHFRVWIDVFHNDRDIEFIQFKRWLISLYNGQNSVLELNYKSCEMIADDLYNQIASRYPNRNVVIDVSEDGENGCVIHYNLTRPSQSIVL